jgi:hypothetical protein
VTYGQVSESILTDVTRNVGADAVEDCVELLVLDGLVVEGLVLDDEVVIPLLESIVPVICTLWLRC